MSLTNSRDWKPVELFEVGPRDGLQSEATILTIDQKQSLVSGLIDAGIRHIEIGSFVVMKNPNRRPYVLLRPISSK